jgi:hypothetical protein
MAVEMGLPVISSIYPTSQIADAPRARSVRATMSVSVSQS